MRSLFSFTAARIYLALIILALLLFVPTRTATPLPMAGPLAAPLTLDRTVGCGATRVDDLKQAIIDVNADGGGTITLTAGCTYTLTTVHDYVSDYSGTYGTGSNIDANGLPAITTDITINGEGAIIERGASAPQFRLLLVRSGSLTLNDTILRGGSAVGDGGAIWFYGGGGTINRSTLYDNLADGNPNASDKNGHGGGFQVNNATVNVINSTLYNNQTDYGAGVFAGGGVGGGSGTANFFNCTVTSNIASMRGGGFRAIGGTVTARNTIFASNEASDGTANCSASIGNTNGNLAYDPTATCNAQYTGDPQLGTFDYHGGKTLVYNIPETSPAIDNGIAAGAPSEDQRGRTRPADGDGSSTDEHDIGAYEYQPLPKISINDVTVDPEGDSGTTTATFTVSLDEADTVNTITVDYATADGTATAPGDYTAKSGTVTFAPNTTTATIEVQVNGDLNVEGDETFLVQLSNPNAYGQIADNEGTCTIVDDEAPQFSIDDVSVTEGDSGSVIATFTVSLQKTFTSAVTVDWDTADDTATIADGDYGAANGTLTIPANTLSGPVQVVVYGDTDVEPYETFFVNLSNPSAGTIADAQGVGTIEDDDKTFATINDVSQNEGNTGTSTMIFTVTLSKVDASVTALAYTTADGTATTADNDYVATNGTLDFSDGSTTKTIDVTINGDTTIEPNETFLVQLTPDATVNVVGDGTGTIQDDDTPSSGGGGGGGGGSGSSSSGGEPVGASGCDARGCDPSAWEVGDQGTGQNQQPGFANTYTLAVPLLNVRRQPTGHPYEGIVDTMVQGEVVRVRTDAPQCVDGFTWYRVQTPRGIVGWAAAVVGKQSTYGMPDVCCNLLTTSEGLILRSSADEATADNILRWYVPTTMQFTARAKLSKWWQAYITYLDGIGYLNDEVWVSNEHVEVTGDCSSVPGYMP